MWTGSMSFSTFTDVLSWLWGESGFLGDSTSVSISDTSSQVSTPLSSRNFDNNSSTSSPNSDFLILPLPAVLVTFGDFLALSFGRLETGLTSLDISFFRISFSLSFSAFSKSKQTFCPFFLEAGERGGFPIICCCSLSLELFSLRFTVSPGNNTARIFLLDLVGNFMQLISFNLNVVLLKYLQWAIIYFRYYCCVFGFSVTITFRIKYN